MYFKCIFIVVFLKCISAEDSTKITFFIDSNSVTGCRTGRLEGSIQDQRKFQIIITSTDNLTYSMCYFYKDGLNLTVEAERIEPRRIVFDSEELRFSAKDMHGKSLICHVEIDLTSIPQNVMPCNGHSCVECKLPLNFTAPVNDVAEGRAPKDQTTDKIKIIIIIIVVGVIVVLIIVGQTIALLYFRRRAKAQNRMENLQNNRIVFHRRDKARYSAPPSRRGTKTDRENVDTNSHIYEMVGVNDMYTGSHKVKMSENVDIKDRPPLPLPGEAYEEPLSIDTVSRAKNKTRVWASTHSLNDTDSTRLVPTRPLKKEPPPPVKPKLSKPPKKADETNTTGSLKPRPKVPKPVPKAGTVPKMMANDPSLIELKNVLRKRNLDLSPPPSAASTLEKKPVIPKKNQIPSPKTPALNRIPTVGVIKLSPNPTPSTAAEAAFKAPKHPKAVPEPLPHPYAASALPVPLTSIAPTPKSHASPKIVPAMPPLPLATQDMSCRPLPPVYSSKEDTSPEDDEEWTYEPLEQFNIYNV